MEEGRESTAVNRSHTQITVWGVLELAGIVPVKLVVVGFYCVAGMLWDGSGSWEGLERASITPSSSDHWLLHVYIHPCGGLPPNPSTAGVCSALWSDALLLFLIWTKTKCWSALGNAISFKPGIFIQWEVLRGFPFICWGGAMVIH